MQERHIDDLVEAYVLGALEAAEVDAVERHLETCAPCRTLVQQARVVTDHLLIAVPQVAPPLSLRSQLLRRIAAEKSETLETSQPDGETGDQRQSHYAPAAAPSIKPGNAFSRFMQTLFGPVATEGDYAGEVLRALLAEPDSFIVQVGGTDDAPGASARLVGAPAHSEAVLVTNGLRPVGADQAYQVWFLKGGQPEPNALFSVNRRGQGTSVVRIRQPLREFDAVAVTPEPAGGSPEPTGPIVLVGAIGGGTAA